MVQELKNYNYEFWHEEDGMELLQLALVVVVVVGIFAVVLGLQSVIADNIGKSANQANEDFENALQQKPGTGQLPSGYQPAN